MNAIQLSWKNLTNKPLSMLLSLVLFALGVGLISLLLMLNKQLQEKFDKNLAGIDLVIGAKGSPLQLILCSMYHIDSPTGNISINEAKAFMRPGHPLIEKAIPLSLGDSYKSYRIVGTSHDFLSLYDAEISRGRLWEKTMEVCLGAGVAADLDLQPGDEFFSSHGFVMDDHLVHDEQGAFVVSGILQATGSVIDQLILTKTQSIWAVHGEADGRRKTEGGRIAELPIAEKGKIGEPDWKPLTAYGDQEITSLLIKFKHRNFQTLNMQRAINENTDMQAASPPIEINRLYGMMGAGAEALRVLAIIIVAVSALSIFISLFSSLKERKYELALMRVMGSSPGKLFYLIIMEGLVLAVLGYIIGMALSHAGMEILAGFMKSSYRYSFSGWVFFWEELFLLFAALGIGFVAAVIPAVQARNTDISKTLAEG